MGDSMNHVLTLCGYGVILIAMSGCPNSDSNVDSPKIDSSLEGSAAPRTPHAKTDTRISESAPLSIHRKVAKLLYLRGRFGDSDSSFGEVTFKIKRRDGKVTKEFEVELEGAKPGAVFPVTVDGVEIGEMLVDLDGEGELELMENDEELFAESFVEPKVGTVVKIGSAFEVTLENLEGLTDLRASLGGSNSIYGEVKFKVERLGEAVIRDFKLEIEHTDRFQFGRLEAFLVLRGRKPEFPFDAVR